VKLGGAGQAARILAPGGAFAASEVMPGIDVVSFPGLPKATRSLSD